MAILSVGEIWLGRDGDAELTGGIEGRLKREYTRAWRVITDSPFVGQLAVMSALGLPALFTPYATPFETDAGSLVQKLSAAQDQDEPTVWIVRVDYSTEIADTTRYAEDPLARPPRIYWDGEAYQKPISQDIDGNPLASSAGEKFDPPIEIDDDRLILIIEKNLAVYNQAQAQQYANKLNSDVFFGGAVGTWKCKPIRATLEYETGIAYYKVRFEFHYRAEGWSRVELDQGYRYIDAGNVPREFVDGSGRQVTTPQLLNGSGGPLPKGVLPNGVPGFGTLTVAATSTVAPGTLGMKVGDSLIIDTGANQETVTITAVTSTGFTANFALFAGHPAGCPYVAAQPYYANFVVYQSIAYAPLNLP